MTDSTSYPDTGDGTDVGSDRGSPPRTPRWVKVFGITFLVLVLMIVIMVASGHGPGRHMPGMSGAAVGSHAPPFSATGQVVPQP